MSGNGRVLVTGAGGFIGSPFVERVRRAGMEVHGVSRACEPGTVDGVRWWRADVADADATAAVVGAVAPDVIVNLAGETRAARTLGLVRGTFDTNLVGTLNLLLAAVETGCARVVLAGSLEEPVGTDTASSPYAASKWAGETYGRMFHELFGLDVVSLRVFMVYGPGQNDLRKLVPYTITALQRGEPPRLTSGSREIDWVFVDDVADAFLAAATARGAAGRTIDIGSGDLVSVREIVRRLTELVAPDIEPVFGAVDDRPAEQVRRADTTAAQALLGWRATTGLDEGLQRTVEWYAVLDGARAT